MESLDAALRQLRRIRDWTQQPLEPEAVMAEIDCAQVLTVVAGRRAPTTRLGVTALDSREHYARLVESLHQVHEIFRTNAQERGLLARARHRISEDGGCSVARNYRGAYETSLLLAYLASAAGDHRTMESWLRTARRMLDRYGDEAGPTYRLLVPSREPGALQAQLVLYQQLQSSFAAGLVRLRQLFDETCELIAA